MDIFRFNSILQALRATQLHTDLCGFNHARSYIENSSRERFLNTSQHWKVYKTASPFTRRVTCARWHPQYPDVVAFGAHSGDILLWHYDSPSVNDPVIKGVGMGYGCITEMRFHPDDPGYIYTSAVDGRFCLQDFEGRQSQVYLDTMEIAYWWCSFDISRNHGLIIVGDNHGNAALLDSDGRSIGTYKRLHKEKIKHLEFCPARPWMMATASVDRTVALWDIRMLKEGAVKGSPLLKSPKPITVMKHGGPVTSCYFDPIHGSRLLTTAQNEEIRVYDSHNGWEEPTVTVNHPHRHFQHMTDIRATWHPLYADLCVVGRYPRKEDDDKTHSVDLIDLVSGQRVGYFYSPHLSNIIQVGHCLCARVCGTQCYELLSYWLLCEYHSATIFHERKLLSRIVTFIARVQSIYSWYIVPSLVSP